MIYGPRPGPLDDDAVLAAYPWPDEGPWVRAMMVTTLDGASAGPDGLSGSISSDVDKAVFDAVRRLADAVLVGAGTIRAEGYGAMRAKDRRRRGAARRPARRPRPVIAIVSPSLDLPWDSELFTGSTEPPLVLTTAAPTADALARGPRGARRRRARPRRRRRSPGSLVEHPGRPRAAPHRLRGRPDACSSR